MDKSRLKSVPFFSNMSKRELAAMAQQTDDLEHRAPPARWGCAVGGVFVGWCLDRGTNRTAAGLIAPRDTEAWVSLIRTAQAAECSVLLLAPTPDAMPATEVPATVHVSYPVLQFMMDTRMRATPITILFGPEWQVLWRREGVLREKDLAGAGVALAWFRHK